MHHCLTLFAVPACLPACPTPARGDFKKLSIDNQSPTTGGFGGAFNQWEVRWNDGITAQGSSGSPLLRASNRRIIGQLRGGSSFCSTPFAPDWYGKISLGFPQGLATFLAGNSGVTAMDGASSPGPMGGNPTPNPTPSPSTCFETQAEIAQQFPCLGNCNGGANGCFCDALVRAVLLLLRSSSPPPRPPLCLSI